MPFCKEWHPYFYPVWNLHMLFIYTIYAPLLSAITDHRCTGNQLSDTVFGNFLTIIYLFLILVSKNEKYRLLLQYSAESLIGKGIQQWGIVKIL
jgi:hypothetical protein